MRNIKRLRVIANLISAKDKTVADIGADHGYLTKLLLEENRVGKVVATDISKPSLEKTAKLAKKYGFSDKVCLKVGDGMKPLTLNEAQVVVIAGMGGNEIIKILSENEDKSIEMFVLAPMQNVVNLRKYLIDNNYEIVKDFIVKDRNKFYNTLVVRFSQTKQCLSEREIEFGLTNFDLKTKDFYDYLLEYKNKQEDILKKYETPLVENKIKEAEKIITELYGDKVKGDKNARNY